MSSQTLREIAMLTNVPTSFFYEDAADESATRKLQISEADQALIKQQEVERVMKAARRERATAFRSLFRFGRSGG